MNMEYDVTHQRQAYLDARGYTILTACPGSGKTTSIVESQVLIDTANIPDLFQVSVHLLVTDYRQQFALW